MNKLHLPFIVILLFTFPALTLTCSRSPSINIGAETQSYNQAGSSSMNSVEVQEITNMIETVNESKILVAYFSCTGNTRSVAVHISNALKADIHEILPQISYTSEDLNWNNSSSRSSIENSNPSSRPAISGRIENIEQYDIIFLGYPIWWGQAPRIILTFLESYNFSGKTIVPFCTSGSSGVGTSATNLHGHCSDNATWLSGTRLNTNSSYSVITAWLNELEPELTIF